ncbi:HEAT repeat domain-containing protein [Kitasatospora sp. NPDC086791]|uniref:NACHT domain-containing protein n=1 Tax=Kitasatospora sp. NPDC086791 TaxID=3155178 RepID=UPI00341641C1
MGGDPEVSAVNRIAVDTITGHVYQGGTINLTCADEPPVTAGSMAAACAAYARRVRETYGRLDLEVLTPLSEQGEHPVVELREVFVTPQVREDPPPVELPRELVQRLVTHGEFMGESLPPGLAQSAFEQLRDDYLDRPTEDAFSALTGPRGQRVVLLGDPGSGKSTLARYLALTLSQDSAGPLAPLDGLVPLVVELRQYAEGQWRERTFEDFLDHRHRVAGMSLPGPELRRLLDEGRVVIVFDGLDELFDPGVRAATAERIAAFAARYDRARVVVTSRVIGYQRAALGGAGFTHFMLQDLDPGRIADFARRWYAIACPADPDLAARLVHRITGAVNASRPIRELAGNPLLLTILAIIGRRQTLPRDRRGVYEHAVRVLVAHWDRDTKHLSVPLKPGAAEAIELLDDRERMELLRLLARRMQEGTGGIAGNHIHAAELEAVFQEYFTQFGLPPHQCLAAARALRDQLRERNFILARYGGEVYGFVHRAFLEHLAAEDIVHRYTVRREWTPEGLIEEVFARRTDDPAWHEVLLLVVNQLSEPDAGAAIDHLLDRRDEASLVLAIRSLAEVRKIGLLRAQSDRAIDGLTGCLSGYSTFAFQVDALLAALSALSSIPSWTGRERYLRWFHLHGQFTSSTNVKITVAVTCHTAIESSLALAAFSSPNNTASAVTALARRWGDHPDIVPSLLALAAGRPSTSLRRKVLIELAEGWPDHPDVLPLLPEIEAAMTRPSFPGVDLAHLRPDHVPGAALWRRDRGDLAQLLDLAADGRTGSVRADALKTLAEAWTRHPDVLPLFLDRAVGDVQNSVREAAVRELARWRTDAPTVLPVLRDRAAHDRSPSTRRRAFEGLALLDADGPETVRLLTRTATGSENSQLRLKALNLLARYRGSRRETVLILLDRVTADPDSTVRGAALSHYAVLAPDDAEAVVLARASGDPGRNVRSQALTMLAWQWPDHPGTSAALERAAASDPDEYVRDTALECREAAAHLTAGA